jgi:hypothetical protein
MLLAGIPLALRASVTSTWAYGSGGSMPCGFRRGNVAADAYVVATFKLIRQKTIRQLAVVLSNIRRVVRAYPENQCLLLRRVAWQSVSLAGTVYRFDNLPGVRRIIGSCSSCIHNTTF